MNGVRGRQGVWRWWALIVGVMVLDLGVLGSQVGRCVDAASGSSAVSTCTVEPAIGWPGAWLVVVLSLITAGVAIVRLAVPARGVDGGTR